DDQREPVGQLRRHAVPHHVGLGEAVQQQQRRSLAADAGEDAAEGSVDPFGGEAGIEVGEIGHLLHPYLSAWDLLGLENAPKQKSRKTTPCTVAKSNSRLHKFGVPTGTAEIARACEKSVSALGLLGVHGLPADVAAAEAFRPIDAVDGLVGA